MPLKKKLKYTFVKVSRLYHSARTGYPDKLFSDIMKISRMGKDGLILDVGCGTGKSTEPFAKRGFSVIGLDIGENLLSIAKRELKKYSNVRFRVGSFEKIKFKSNYFDLIVCGQAFHWLDHKVAFKNSVDFLKKDGFFAVFSKFQKKDSRFSSEIMELFVNNCPNYPRDKFTYKEYALGVSKKINESNLFFKPIIKKYISSFRYSKKLYRDLILSFSWVSSLSKDNKKIFVDKLDKILNKRKWPFYIYYDNVLIMAKVKK